jgi:hypothetical protein
MASSIIRRPVAIRPTAVQPSPTTSSQAEGSMAIQVINKRLAAKNPQKTKYQNPIALPKIKADPAQSNPQPSMSRNLFGKIGAKGKEKVGKRNSDAARQNSIKVNEEVWNRKGVTKSDNITEEGFDTKAQNNNGRVGRPKQLRKLMHNDKVSSADRGWLKQDQNQIIRGKRQNLRVPKGKELAHRTGFEAAKGYDYSYADLQDKDLHKLQHKYDGMGKKNKINMQENNNANKY